MQSQETQLKHLPLEKPIRITEQVWPEGTIPVVSVYCLTYNHKNFIRDAIEGFLMQETTFPVGIFIHDDASTDSTAKIVTDYAERYPNLFWTVLQTENQWSKGNRKFLIDYLIKQRGEFIALCEGDDYWTVNNKLQKQVDFLRMQKDSVGVFHRGYAVDFKKKRIPYYWDSIIYEVSYKQEDCIFKLKSSYPTASLVFKKHVLDQGYPDYYIKSPCDFNLDIVLSEFGSLYFQNFEGSAYRQHQGGIWSSLSKFEQKKNLCFRYINLLQNNNIRKKYKICLLNSLYECYEKIWWEYYKAKNFKIWLYSIKKLLVLFFNVSHVYYFIQYFFRSKSAPAFTLRDLILDKQK
jgi:glycosyltransferase involved in cell wall biosynthesis